MAAALRPRVAPGWLLAALPRSGPSSARPAPRPASRGFAAAAVQLYQYEICPFCCKIKAFLDWQKVAYRTVEVNPLSKAEIKHSEYRKVPIAQIDGKQVNDSSVILDVLASKLALVEDLGDPETKKWLEWCDKELAVLLFPNITRNFGESWQAFSYISEVPSFGPGAKAANRLAGSVAMWLAKGKLKRKHNITDERRQLREAVQVWLDAVGAGGAGGGGPFLRGARLTLPDVAVYGVVSAIRGLRAHQELMEAAPGLRSWSQKVRAAVGASARVEDPPVRRSVGLAAA